VRAGHVLQWPVQSLCCELSERDKNADISPFHSSLGKPRQLPANLDLL